MADRMGGVEALAQNPMVRQMMQQYGMGGGAP